MNVLMKQFRSSCMGYYSSGHRDTNDVAARIGVYRNLIRRHGGKTVSRHWRAIGAVLDRAELEYAHGEARRLLSELER